MRNELARMKKGFPKRKKITAAERSEGRHSRDRIGQVRREDEKPPAGIATSSHCPRRGYVRLSTFDGRVVYLPTTCKTWGCKGCRDKLRSLFILRVNTGFSILGRCAFLTITYRVKAGTALKDAESVRRHWAALLRAYRKYQPEIAAMKWLRVVELTQRGQPHLHLMIGPLGSLEARCWSYSGPIRTKEYLKNWEECGCLSHVVSRLWYKITGDSWVVHAKQVDSSPGDYMGKYLEKTFLSHGELARRGFKRRWSSSRGYPGSGRMRLLRTGTEGWQRVDHVSARVAKDLMDRNDPNLLIRVGNHEMVKLVAKGRKAGIVRKLKRLLNVEDVRKEVVPGVDGDRER